MSKGEIRLNFDLRDFSLGAGDYERGLASFRGELAKPLPVLLQTEADLKLAGWGCAVFAVRNALAVLGSELETAFLTGLALEHGADVVEGANGETVAKLLLGLGFPVETVAVGGLEDLKTVIAKGGVVLAAVFSHDWGKRHRSGLQTFESHWVAVPAVDGERLVVMDSDLGQWGIGRPISGVYTLPWTTFDRIDYYFELEAGAFVSRSEDFVWGESTWYHHDVLAVYPPLNREKLLE